MSAAATTPPGTRHAWVVEDNDLFRGAVLETIATAPRAFTARGFATAEDALGALAAGGIAPDVVLLDIGLPGMNGLDFMARLRAASPRSQVIVLTVYEDDEKILRAARGGAAGYLLKSASLADILDALRRTVSGEAALDGTVARRLLQLVADPPAADATAALTAREQAILAALCRGESGKEIAVTLGVSPHTVDFHLRHIYRKLGVHSATGAVSAAHRRGLA